MGFLGMVRCANANKASRPGGAREGTPSESDWPPKCAGAAAAGKKRRRHSQAVPRWRPSLGAISENAVFCVGDAAEGEKRSTGAARAAAQEKTKRAALTLANAVARARSWGSSGRAFAAQQTAVPEIASAPIWF